MPLHSNENYYYYRINARARLKVHTHTQRYALLSVWCSEEKAKKKGKKWRRESEWEWSRWIYFVNAWGAREKSLFTTLSMSSDVSISPFLRLFVFTMSAIPYPILQASQDDDNRRLCTFSISKFTKKLDDAEIEATKVQWPKRQTTTKNCSPSRLLLIV